MKSFWERGGAWVVGQAFVVLAVVGLSLRFDRTWSSAIIVRTGAVLFVLAAIFGICGFAALGSNLTPLPQPTAKAYLVRHGIYGKVRHPIYTGVLLFLTGWALVWQSWPGLVAALGSTLFFDAKARREERWLRARFPEYAAYQAETRRFIPWIY